MEIEIMMLRRISQTQKESTTFPSCESYVLHIHARKAKGMSKVGWEGVSRLRRCEMCSYETRHLRQGTHPSKTTVCQEQLWFIDKSDWQYISRWANVARYDSFTFSAFVNVLVKAKSLCLSQRECGLPRCALKRM